MNLPAPSAWRYTHHIPDGTISYQYDTARPKNCNHQNYTPMFTQGQLNQYGQACFEEGRDARAMVEPMTDVADRYAHRMAMVLECVLMDRASDRWWNEGVQLIGEYRSAMNAIHEQHSPTHMGEPLLHNAEVSGAGTASAGLPC